MTAVLWLADSDGVAPLTASYALCECGRRIRSRNARCVVCYRANRRANASYEPPTGTCLRCGGRTSEPQIDCCAACRPARDRAQNLARFWTKVDQSAGPDGCWPWMAYVDPTNGYGQSTADGRTQAHRRAYRLTFGPIAAGLEIDHLCHDPRRCLGGPTCPHRRCCNPTHLEAVTHAENVRRGRSVKRNRVAA